MPRVLIAGCGYLGIAAAKLFTAKGYNITAWTRSGEIADHDLAAPVATRAVDLREQHDVRRNRFACDVVIHCASSGGGDAVAYRRIYRDGARNLAEAFPGARLIFTSSTSVYAQNDASWVDENSTATPISEKGKILREAESVVLDHGGVVLRLGGIYGPGRSFLLQSVRRGTATIAGPDRYVNQIHRDDAAAAIAVFTQCAEVVSPHIFNVVDDTPTARSEVLRWLSGQLQIPLSHSSEADRPKRGDSNKRVSNAKLRALGWSPLYPGYKEGFLNSILANEPPRF